MSFQDEIKTYLGQVQRGRRVATHNPKAPQFSQEAEMARQVKAIDRANAMAEKMEPPPSAENKNMIGQRLEGY